MIEYVLWGIAPGTEEEQILVTRLYKRPIARLSEAEALVSWCEKQGCTSVRIQAVDLSTKPDFSGCITR